MINTVIAITSLVLLAPLTQAESSDSPSVLASVERCIPFETVCLPVCSGFQPSDAPGPAGTMPGYGPAPSSEVVLVPGYYDAGVSGGGQCGSDAEQAQSQSAQDPPSAYEVQVPCPPLDTICQPVCAGFAPSEPGSKGPDGVGVPGYGPGPSSHDPVVYGYYYVGVGGPGACGKLIA